MKQAVALVEKRTQRSYVWLYVLAAAMAYSTCVIVDDTLNIGLWRIMLLPLTKIIDTILLAYEVLTIFVCDWWLTWLLILLALFVYIFRERMLCLR